ncbi:MAG: phage baseplate assembly protein V [Rhizomicrobium sp.]
MRFSILPAAGALAALAAASAQAAGYDAIYRAHVMSSDDPLGAHRLRVVVPDVGGTTERWANPSVPYTADPSRIALPPDGSTVWVLFEDGDTERPVWIGWYPEPAAAPHRHGHRP